MEGGGRGEEGGGGGLGFSGDERGQTVLLLEVKMGVEVDTMGVSGRRLIGEDNQFRLGLGLGWEPDRVGRGASWMSAGGWGWQERVSEWVHKGNG